MLSADFNRDFEKNLEAQILRRVEALPVGQPAEQSDPILMKMLHFASARRPWLAWNIENFDRFNDPLIRFKSWTDEHGQKHSCDNLLISMRKVLDLEEHSRTRYQFTGPNGRRVPSLAERNPA
tara:strand:- start:4538 stop:4906 length:369 start_codon:yes stop_codon:yes gene_type:complete